MPGLGLAFKVLKIAKKHGPTILHGSDIDLITKDLGDALRRQKKVIIDQDLSAIETAIEIGPVLAEVKILTAVVAKKNGLETKGKSNIAVLEEIVQKTEERKSTAASEIKDTLDWTRAFFSHPKIAEALGSEMTSLELPELSIGGITKALTNTAVRSTQEFSRIQDVLKAAKEVGDLPPPKPKRAPRARKPKDGPSA
jgi:hypothetical protein